MTKVNTLTLDEQAVLEAIRHYFEEALDDAAEYFLDRFSEEIMKNGVGKMEWRQDIAAALEIVSKRSLDDYLEVVAGVPDWSNNKTAHDIASVVLFGNKALDDAIYTKPGFDVYGKDMNAGRHVSTAKTARYLPEGFSVEPKVNGEQMVQNALKLSAVYFRDVIDAAAKKIPESIFYGNVSVTGG